MSHCGPKNNGRFAYIEHGKIRIGWNHKPMTKAERNRMFWRNRKAFPYRSWRTAAQRRLQGAA